MTAQLAQEIGHNLASSGFCTMVNHSYVTVRLNRAITTTEVEQALGQHGHDIGQFTIVRHGDGVTVTVEAQFTERELDEMRDAMFDAGVGYGN